jgi:retron-type reverse transcriptase
MTSRDERLLTQRRIRAAIAPSGNLEAPLDARLASVDPFAEDVGARMSAALDEVAAPIWPRLSDRLQPLPAEVILENAWATIAHKPLWVALLNRSIRLGDSEAARRRLDAVQRSSGADWRNASAYAWAAVPGAPRRGALPAVFGLDDLPWSIRARFGLASLVRNGAGPRELLGAAANIVSPDVRAVANALRAAIAHAASPASALTSAEIARLKDSEQTLLLASAELQDMFLEVRPVGGRGPRPDVAECRARYEHAVRAFRAISGCLERHAWAQAGQLVRDVPVDEVTLAAAEDALRVPSPTVPATKAAGDSGPDTKSASTPKRPSWAPMASAEAKRLAAFLRGAAVPPQWSMPQSRVIGALVSGRLSAADLPTAERAHLGRCMSQADRARLARAERFEWVDKTESLWKRLPLPAVFQAARQRPDDALELLTARLSELPDAGPVIDYLGDATNPEDANLAQRTVQAAGARDPSDSASHWDIATAPFIGTAIWHRALERAAVSPASAERMLDVLAADIEPADRNAFDRMLEGLVFVDSGAAADRANDIARWLQCEPAAVSLVARRIDVDTASALARLPESTFPDALLNGLIAEAPPLVRDALWQAEVARARSASDLVRQLLTRAQQARVPEWHPGWMDLAGTGVERATALALAGRRSAARLKSLGDACDAADLSKGLAEAARLLPHACRVEAVYLELLSLIGVKHAPSLAWVIARRRRDASAGQRVDHMYTQHELPKDSGGTRIISVPDDRLKRVQRAILHNLLAPLGAHPSAFGFVPGRGIRDNAAVHVGQAIVANADVRNCFPSVGWRLVRAALQRDLGATLSPAAISILVDLCTGHGGLPIGAPTSPALLNRVLLKSDEILTSEAQRRGCRYSRYADDLSFSGSHEAVRMLGVAKRCLDRIGLELDPKKTNIFRRGRRQVCTGLVVNDKVSIPRRVRRRLRAAVHAAEAGRSTHWHGTPASLPQLKGRLAFLQMIHPDEGFELRNRLVSALGEGNE